jgi:hypothetical protein
VNAQIISRYEITPESFRAYLDGIEDRNCAFRARDCDFCPLAYFVNHLADDHLGGDWLRVGVGGVSTAGNLYVCSLPQWAVRFERLIDRRDAGEKVYLPEVYAALEEATS